MLGKTFDSQDFITWIGTAHDDDYAVDNDSCSVMNNDSDGNREDDNDSSFFNLLTS